MYTNITMDATAAMWLVVAFHIDSGRLKEVSTSLQLDK
jgi:hypothetical protein